MEIPNAVNKILISVYLISVVVFFRQTENKISKQKDGQWVRECRVAPLYITVCATPCFPESLQQSWRVPSSSNPLSHSRLTDGKWTRLKWTGTLSAWLSLKACHGGWRSVESVVELVGELVMFSLVSFIQYLSHSTHAASGGMAREESRRGRQEEKEQRRGTLKNNLS